ncbi:MAG TPA: endonuclease Q family protein [bacterium]
MKIIADFHIHSKYSRATSPDMTADRIAHWADIKGINIIGTGDFTHPLYFNELKQKLEPSENGLFKLKQGTHSARFVLTAEVSNIFDANGRTKKIHSVIFAPNLTSAEKLNSKLSGYGKLSADGRPIFTFHVKDLVKMSMDISEDFLIVPAHAWTPWFSVFGSKSGFDSIEDAFGSESRFIYAIETGLSSDPAMNWRLSKLDKVALISNSDAHSPRKIGREANVFDCELDYKSIVNAIKSRDKNRFLMTIEFFPEEGKYHFDGHRACNVFLHPKESIKNDNRCPVCGRPLTVGVLHRVEELADRAEGCVPEGAVSQRNLVPLEEIIAEAFGVGTGTARVESEYKKMVSVVCPEFTILMDLPFEEIKRISDSRVAEGIIRVREVKVQKTPGYDGVYGKISVFSGQSDTASSSFKSDDQMKLF